MSCSGSRVPNRTRNIPPFKSRFRQSRSPRVFNIPRKIFAFLGDVHTAEILDLEHLCYREIRKKCSDGTLGPVSYIKTHLACFYLSSLDIHIYNSSEAYLPKTAVTQFCHQTIKSKFRGANKFFLCVCVLVKCNEISARDDSTASDTALRLLMLEFQIFKA